MQYIKLDEDKYVEISDGLDQSSIVSRSAIQNEVDVATEQIATLPEPLSDDQLLAWARENYQDPAQRNREVLQQTIDEYSQKLADIDAGSVDASVMLKNVIK